MYEELKEKAVKNLKKKQRTKKAVYIVGFIFAAISFILYTISLNFDPFVSYWIKFPILILALVYGIVYFSALGFPFMSEELTDEEIEREIVKIFKLQEIQDDDFPEELELKEIEALRNKWEDGEEYV